MPKKRGARVAPPPRDGEWALFFYDAEAADGWEDLCKQVRGATRTRPIGPQFQGGIAYGVVGEMPS